MYANRSKPGVASRVGRPWPVGGKSSSPSSLFHKPCVFVLHGPRATSFSNSHKGAVRTRAPGGGAGEERSPEEHYTCSRGQDHNGDRGHCQEHSHDRQGPAQGLQVHGQPWGRRGADRSGNHPPHPTQHHTDSDTNIVPTLAPTLSAQDTWKKHSI